MKRAIEWMARSVASLCCEVLMSMRNRWSRAPLSVGEGPVVSLTSYGARLNRVHLTIESIASGTMLPSRLILWVDDLQFLEKPSAGVSRLVRRGLELRHTPDWGPHKKYFPYVTSTTDLRSPLVTADDDVYYARRWLSALFEAHKTYPDDVIALRARLIALVGDNPRPYREWGMAPIGVRSACVFPTGVGGVLYPGHMQDVLRNAGSAFEDCAPRADDVWLHANAIANGIYARRVRPVTLIPIVPVRGSGGDGLWETNVVGSGNDAQIRSTYRGRHIEVLARSCAGGS